MVIPGTPPPRPTKFIQVTRTLLIVIFVLALFAPPLIVWFILSGADDEPREDLIDFAPKQELQWPTR